VVNFLNFSLIKHIIRSAVKSFGEFCCAADNFISVRQVASNSYGQLHLPVAITGLKSGQ